MEEIKLVIPLATYRKIMAYISICELEISGFCEVEYNAARNLFIAGEVYLLDQEVSGSGTHMDEEAVSKFNLERIKDGAEQLPRIWWHSHVNMEAFFSAIDEATLKDLQNDSFIIALVGNKRKEMRAKAYVYNETISTVMGLKFEKKEQIEVDPLPWSIELEYERIPENLKKEVDKKVREKKYTGYLSKPHTKSPTIFDGKNRHAHNDFPIAKALQLPKDPIAAHTRIEELGLVKEWDKDLKDFVYRDPYNQQIWVDYWKALDKFDDEELFGGVKK